MENPQRFGGKGTIIGLRQSRLCFPKAAKQIVLRLPWRDLACILGQPPMLFLDRANVPPTSYTLFAATSFKLLGTFFCKPQQSRRD
jgi:hypothetical protein